MNSSSGLAADPALLTAAEKSALQKRLFTEADTNHNGQVSRQEFIKFVFLRQFSNADTKKDGKVSKAEFMANMKGVPDQTRLHAEWKSMDPTGKGYIVPADMIRDQVAISDLQQKFREFDMTGKGYIPMAGRPKLMK